MATEVTNPFIRMNHPAMTLVRKRLRHDSDRQDAEFARDARHDRGGTRPGPAAHPCGHKYHVRAFKALSDMIFAFQRRVFPDFRFRPGAEPPGPFRTQLNLIRRSRSIQRLQIGIRRDEIDPRQSGRDHGVNGVAPSATNTDHFDPNGGYDIFLK
jgi:hypothetical protein